jgi:hypothetical protein
MVVIKNTFYLTIDGRPFVGIIWKVWRGNLRLNFKKKVMKKLGWEILSLRREN